VIEKDDQETEAAAAAGKPEEIIPEEDAPAAEAPAPAEAKEAEPALPEKRKRAAAKKTKKVAEDEDDVDEEEEEEEEEPEEDDEEAPPKKSRKKSTSDKSKAAKPAVELSGQPGTKERLPEKGQKVTWKAGASYAEGEVIEIVKEDTMIGNRKFKASDKDPRVKVLATKSGKEAVHKPEALHWE